MKKYVVLLFAIFLVGCGKKEYEKKNLSYEDGLEIEVGLSETQLLEKLGAPLKIWENEDFIYDELDDAVSRDDLIVALSESKPELLERHTKAAENGNKAKKIKVLNVYQYTTRGDSKGTFLVWIDPEKKNVVYTNSRSYMDEKGKTINEGQPSDESEISQEEPEAQENTNTSTVSIGEEVIFSTGIKITVTSVELSNENTYEEINGNLVKVDFTIDNQSDEEFDFNPHAIDLYDSEREKAELNSKDFYSENIAVGMKSSGTAYYDSINTGPFTIIIGAGTWVSK